MRGKGEEGGAELVFVVASREIANVINTGNRGVIVICARAYAVPRAKRLC